MMEWLLTLSSAAALRFSSGDSGQKEQLDRKDAEEIASESAQLAKEA